MWVSPPPRILGSSHRCPPPYGHDIWEQPAGEEAKYPLASAQLCVLRYCATSYVGNWAAGAHFSRTPQSSGKRDPKCVQETVSNVKRSENGNAASIRKARWALNKLQAYATEGRKLKRAYSTTASPKDQEFEVQEMLEEHEAQKLKVEHVLEELRETLNAWEIYVVSSQTRTNATMLTRHSWSLEIKQLSLSIPARI